MPGDLYVVATPIGNLADITLRAREVLGKVDLIAAEDTRHSKKLLDHIGINTQLLSYHEHSDTRRESAILNALAEGRDVALISDAGTPLISDPGYQLVRAARERDVRVVPIPGACAAIAALSVAGLPSDRFVFEGFLPQKSGPRIKKLAAVVSEPRTLIYYEAPHRIVDTLADMTEVFGGARKAVMAREITKAYETFLSGTLDELKQQVQQDSNQQRGEIVVMVRGLDMSDTEPDLDEQQRVLSVLLEELPLKQAVALAVKITDGNKNTLYKKAVELKNNTTDQ